ncbi:MAG TPA: anhydro-N-acetylmuramic acid kinase, partial [Bacteroidales bacterium]
PNKGLTLQIGNGANIAAQTGITTICDFRTMDVALGGQGAPLVPIGDKFLFADYEYCLNLGGFANISFENNGKRLAYDICPTNIVINYLVKERNLNFDPDGSIARQGKLNESLLNDMNNLSFYHQNGPKSLGKEWVLKEMFPIINSYNISIEDKLRTYYQHIAIQIKNALSHKPGEKMLITGGGAHNIFLMELFNSLLKTEIQIPVKEVTDYKEALIFAFLGILRFRKECNCLASVTGAKNDNIGGIIYQI